MVAKRSGPAEGDSLSNGALSHGKERSLRVGGQAVIEGVMMRSPNAMAIAVRRPNGEIAVKREGLKFFSERTVLFRIPLLRGVLTLMGALILGVQALQYSANQALPEREEVLSPWAMGLTLSGALCVGILLFFLAPLYLTKWMKFALPMLSRSGILFNLVDGGIRLAIFLLYLWSISFFKEIRRVFQYHGAEHKSVFAFEAGELLRVDRVMGYSVLHPRCGTSFLLVVMVVSILVFALVPHHLPFGYKVLSRVVLIPVIAGLSYEVIRLADNHRDRKGVQYLVKPGLWLQRLTAREPSEAQVEVALCALKEVLDLEGHRK